MIKQQKKLRFDRLAVLTFLIGIEYFLWLTANQITFTEVYLIGFVAICCFICLIKNPLFEYE